MSALCTGLALLGLCFPLPGHSLESVERAGWGVFDKDQPVWSASKSFSSGTYHVSALISGRGGAVVSLGVIEKREESVASPLEMLVERSCSGPGKARCVFNGVSVFRASCGWSTVFVATAADLGGARKLCEVDRELFESVLKK